MRHSLSLELLIPKPAVKAAVPARTRPPSTNDAFSYDALSFRLFISAYEAAAKSRPSPGHSSLKLERVRAARVLTAVILATLVMHAQATFLAAPRSQHRRAEPSFRCQCGRLPVTAVGDC
jgi:hypothetical protein